MRLCFQPMNRNCAEDVASWVYAAPYDVYGHAAERREVAIREMTMAENRFFAVMDGDELIGFRSFGEDGRVKGGHYDDCYLDTGGGLRPDLTGKGIGAMVIEAGLWFGCRTFGVRRFRVTIADFNQRAQKAVRKVGFYASGGFARPSDGKRFSLFCIELEALEPVGSPGCDQNTAV